MWGEDVVDVDVTVDGSTVLVIVVIEVMEVVVVVDVIVVIDIMVVIVESTQVLS